MSKIVSKVKILKEPAAIFASALTTDYIELSNYKTVDFIVSTGEGATGTTTLKVLGKLGESGTEKEISFKEKIGASTYNQIEKDGASLTIGGSSGECGYGIYRVEASDLAHDGYDRIALSLTEVASSTVVGTITVILYEPRYTE